MFLHIFKQTTSKKPEWLAELSRKQQHRKSEKFLDQSKRPVVDANKPARHSMAPFGIHSLNRQGGIGAHAAETTPSLSSDNVEDVNSNSGRAPFTKFDNTESTSVNAMVNSSTKPVIPPVSEKPYIPQDKPHIPSKPLSTNFNNKDSGTTGHDAIGN